MKTIIYLLFVFYYLLYSIPAAYAATPTPILGEVGVKAEVKSPKSAANQSGSAGSSGSADVSTPSGSQYQIEQPVAEDRKDNQSPLSGLPAAQVQEGFDSGGSKNLAEQTLNMANDLLIKDNSWVRTLAVLWIIFSFVVALLILRRRNMQKEELQNFGSRHQTPGEAGVTDPSVSRPSDGIRSS